MKRGHNNRTSIVVDTDDRAFCRPDREQEPDRTFNRDLDRVPLETQKLCEFEARPGFKNKLVPDLPGEIARHERAGWKVVTSIAANTSDDHGRSIGQLDSVVRVQLNKRADAPWHNAILMEQPLEYWQEDEERRHEAIRKREESFNPEKYQQKGFDSGSYGHLKRERKYFKR